jgi:NAD(P)-dependent dehydrogenase (short-subunit alcohol dehydrogenase family)
VMRELSGKVAVVTGAASGIGLALCRRFGADGMRVMMADVEEPALEAAARSLAEDGIEAAAAVTDVSDPDSVDALARATLGRFGAVHLVCNNAGVGGGGLAWQVPVPAWTWIVGVNLFGVANGIRSFVPHLIEQGEGHVVNTASLAGLLASPGLSAYTATKHAVVGLSESLRHDLAAVGSPVGVSVLCPGFVRTRIAEADRNWPARLGPPPVADDQPGAEQMRQAVAGAIESGLDPAVIAEAVRDAVVAGRFWILTHPEFNDAVAGRLREAVAGADPGSSALV